VVDVDAGVRIEDGEEGGMDSPLEVDDGIVEVFDEVASPRHSVEHSHGLAGGVVEESIGEKIVSHGEDPTAVAGLVLPLVVAENLGAHTATPAMSGAAVGVSSTCFVNVEHNVLPNRELHHVAGAVHHAEKRLIMMVGEDRFKAKLNKPYYFSM
jgi:hypothetical protein